MESALGRIVCRLFARAPRIYLATLKALRRGSVEKHLYLSIVRRGDAVFDIGANVGYFTMFFSDLVGKKGEVHAFEPIPSTFQKLSENIYDFPKYTNVQLNCVALGAKSQRVNMFLPGDDHGQAALVRHRDGSWQGAEVSSFSAEMTRLDDYAANLDRIDFIKCDVEGAELLVLRGGQSTLRRCRPKLFLEVEERWMKSFAWTVADLFSFLRQIGYSHFYGISSRVTPLTEDYFMGGAILCSWEEVRGLA
jgi:FkbM family methyltransferase